MGFNQAIRKKNAIIIVSALGAILLFYFGYYPKATEVRSLTAKYKGMKDDVEGFYSFIGGRGNLKDNIINMRRDTERLEYAFPPEKEVSGVIKYINSEAKRFKVNISSFKPDELYQYKGPSDNILVISGRICKCMPLSLKVDATYQALGEFMDALETANAPVITVKSLDINKDEAIRPLLRATIDMVVYLTGS